LQRTFTRITVPCLRGLRIPVAIVVGMVADGKDEHEILAAYPDLEAEDICEAPHHAAEREPPRSAAG
jgi:uncharacterized protein (DUF433 family)